MRFRAAQHRVAKYRRMMITATTADAPAGKAIAPSGHAFYGAAIHAMPHFTNFASYFQMLLAHYLAVDTPRYALVNFHATSGQILPVKRLSLGHMPSRRRAYTHVTIAVSIRGRRDTMASQQSGTHWYGMDAACRQIASPRMSAARISFDFISVISRPPPAPRKQPHYKTASPAYT